MKKQLLSMAIAVLAILGFSNQISAQELGYSVKQIAKFSTDIPEAFGARQAVALNGKFYIQKKGSQWTVGEIEIWDQNGKTSEKITGTGNHTALSSDDAGNIIVVAGDYAFPSSKAYQTLKVFPADGSTPKEIIITGAPEGRMDVLGHISGDILNGDAVLYLPQNGTKDFFRINFKNGAQVGNASKISMTNQYASIDNMTVADALADGFFYHQRASSFRHFLVNGTEGNYTLDESWGTNIAGGSNDDPESLKNTSNGSCLFTFKNKEYMLYPIGTNYADGWAMVEGKNGKNVIFKKLETQNIAPNKTTFGNILTAEVVGDKVMIYHFFPGTQGYIAVYEYSKDYPEAVYVAGTNNGWNAVEAETLTMTQPGIYEGLVTFAAEENGRGRFELSTMKADWDAGFNAHKIGSDSDGAYWFEETQKVPTVMGKNTGFSINNPGTYNVVVDLSNNFVALYPENVYIVGSLYEKGWNTATAPAFTYEGNGKYSLLETILMPNVENGQNMNAGLAEFTFITNCSAEGDKNIWEKPNQRPRYGAENTNIELESGKAAKVAKKGGDALNWKIETGKYRLDLDLNNMTVVATYLNPTGVKETEAVAAATVIGGEGFIEVAGDAENVEVYTIAGALVSAGQKSVECAAGIYIVNVDGNATKVAVR